MKAAYHSTGSHGMERSKRNRPEAATTFDSIPDEIVGNIIGAVAETADSPADLASATMACKRFCTIGQSNYVRKKASNNCLAVRAKNWSPFAERFLQRCAEAGNLHAGYFLGMIKFYCTREREAGSALILEAAVGGLKDAIYSLAVIVFNGSGGTRETRNLSAAVALCATAASLGSVDALRELGFCMKDGYGVGRSVEDGRRLIVLAKAREISENSTGSTSLINDGKKSRKSHANSFMVEWFSCRKALAHDEGSTAPIGEQAGVGTLRMCANFMCGREETRTREFRRCSVCAAAHYCSRACQAKHWSISHKNTCAPA